MSCLVGSRHDGQVGPLIAFGSGWHVVRLVKREYAGRMPFDEKTQLAIKNKLSGTIWEREYKRILAELRRKATIEISTSPSRLAVSRNRRLLNAATFDLPLQHETGRIANPSYKEHPL